MIFLALIIGAVLMAGFWRSGMEVHFLGVGFSVEGLLRDVLFIIAAALSLKFTTRATREANHFTWDPILEVGKLFFGIFICIVPVLEMLRAGHNGEFAPLVALVTNADGEFNNTVFFWLTGVLSAFLDNAPTYLAFFNLAGGVPETLMTTHSHTLMAISLGSVFMGAMTYIGNAPNFMTVAICNERGIKMPSFFGYMVWSVLILIPTFMIMDLVQYRLNSVNSAAGEIPRRYCCFCLFGKGALVCRFLLLAWMPLAILALWAVVSANAWVPPLLLPTPWAVLTRGWVLITSGELLHHVWVSCLRVLGGFTLSATLAMVMAFWTHQSEKADLSWRVVLDAFRVIPPLALIPLKAYSFARGARGARDGLTNWLWLRLARTGFRRTHCHLVRFGLSHLGRRDVYAHRCGARRDSDDRCAGFRL